MKSPNQSDPPPEAERDFPASTQPTLDFVTGTASNANLPAEFHPFADGQLLAGRYRIARLLGSGGMGDVFEAEDIELRIRVALKTIRASSSSGLEALERFKREVQLARKVTHPNVCRIFDLGCHDEASSKTWFLTMELLAAPTLATFLSQSGPMSPGDALPIVRQMALALEAAHAQGIVHRDFKSANVILLPQNTSTGTSHQAKITDFGLARAIAGEQPENMTLSAPGMLTGTPAYMAPEQVLGEETSARTDIYALGVVMYEMLTGSLPFTGPTPLAIAGKRLNEPPISPRFHVPDIDARWEAVILRCLARQPSARYASAAEVIQALEGGTAEKPPLHQRTESQARWMWPLTSGVILCLLLAGAYAYFKKPQPPPAATSPAALAAAQRGWRQTVVPSELSLQDVSLVAATPSSTELSLFNPSLSQVLDPGHPPQPAVQTSFLVDGRADCGSELWLVHDDHRNITQWDLENHRPLQTIRLPQAFQAASCLDAPGGKWAILLAEGEVSRLSVVDSKTQQIVRSVALEKDAQYFKLTSPDSGHSLVLLGRNGISLRDDQLREVFHDSTQEALIGDTAYGWSPSGRYFALGVKQLEVYDLHQKKREATIAVAGWIRGVGWISDGRVSAMDDRGRLYETADWSRGWQFQQSPPTESVYRCFWIASDLSWLAVSQDGRMFMADYRTPPVLDLAISPLELWSVAPDPQGSLAAVSGKNPSIYLVDLQKKHVIRTLEGHTDGVPFVRFDAWRRLISAGDDGTIRLWDVDNGKLLKTVQAHHSLVNGFAISPSGRWMISVSSDANIKIWALPDLTLVKDLGITKNSGAAVAFPAKDDRHFLVSDWKGSIYLYEGDPPNWQMKRQFQLSTEVVYMLCPARDGWWATSPAGSGAGLWLIPAADIAHTTKFSAEAGYCFTSEDGELTATTTSTGIDVRSNLTGEIEESYFFENQAGAPVALGGPSKSVLAGLANGHFLTWSTSATQTAGDKTDPAVAPPLKH